DLFERVLIACGLHVAEGSKIWDAYKSYEEAILNKMNETDLEVVQHGACLGLGLAALGTADEDIYDEIKSVLYTESVVAAFKPILSPSIDCMLLHLTHSSTKFFFQFLKSIITSTFIKVWVVDIVHFED
nr:26S proteasome non-ATPase regulatory subunit 1 homolog A-like [Tanacetum cinerariifolium]